MPSISGKCTTFEGGLWGFPNSSLFFLKKERIKSSLGADEGEAITAAQDFEEEREDRWTSKILNAGEGKLC